MNRTPPIEFIEIGLDPAGFKPAGPAEWHGPCPTCGGKDRFVIFTDREFPSWNYFCRQCTPDGGWVDQLKPQLQKPLTPERAIAFAKAAEERLQASIELAQAAIAELRSSRQWLEYHENLTDGTRALWSSWGVPDFWQEYWKLGHDPDRVVYSNGEPFHTPTLTIPIFEPVTWEVLNVRHRLLAPPSPDDKYRPERTGLPQSFFVAEPDNPLAGPTVLVEGEKKAMVVYITADSPNLQVVASQGKNIRADLLTQLRDCDPIWIIPDPGSVVDWIGLARTLGFDRTRIIELPGKVDDLIVHNQLDKSWLRSIMKGARRFTSRWSPKGA